MGERGEGEMEEWRKGGRRGIKERGERGRMKEKHKGRWREGKRAGKRER